MMICTTCTSLVYEKETTFQTTKRIYPNTCSRKLPRNKHIRAPSTVRQSEALLGLQSLLLRVQVPHNHILTPNLYYNYCYPNPKYPIMVHGPLGYSYPSPRSSIPSQLSMTKKSSRAGLRKARGFLLPLNPKPTNIRVPLPDLLCT